ncbi:hypothetical protein ACFQX7_26530 [Luedemannella flava]
MAWSMPTETSQISVVVRNDHIGRNRRVSRYVLGPTRATWCWPPWVTTPRTRSAASPAASAGAGTNSRTITPAPATFALPESFAMWYHAAMTAAHCRGSASVGAGPARLLGTATVGTVHVHVNARRLALLGRDDELRLGERAQAAPGTSVRRILK